MPEIWIEHNLEEVSDDFITMAATVPEEVLLPVATKLGNEAQRLFRGTVRTWRDKPVFDMDVDVSRDRVAVVVGTDNKVYGWVNAGTPAHPIVARNASVLAFPAASTSKTEPGSLQSGPGSRSGDMVFRRRVMHPGIRARRFTDRVFELVDKMALSELSSAVDKWLRKRL